MDIRNFFKKSSVENQNSIESSKLERVVERYDEVDREQLSESSNSKKEQQCSFTRENIQRNKTGTTKKREWNYDYIMYGFYRTEKEMLNPYPSACCLFCPAIFGNSNLAPSHLQKHLKTQYPNHQNKSKAFFEESLCDKQKQVSLLESQVKSGNELVLASLKMAHVVMKRKRPYTELESVLPCLEIAADILHGGKKAVSKVREIPLSDNTTKRRCDDISKDLLKQPVIKLKKSPAYDLQLDETTDISDNQQLIVCCRFVDTEAKTTVEHYLCCVKVGVSATAQSMFDKLNEFIEKHDLDWTKCKSVTTDGVAAMQGCTNGVV